MNYSIGGVLNGARYSRIFYEAAAAESAAIRHRRGRAARDAQTRAYDLYSVEIEHGVGSIHFDLEAPSAAAAKADALRLYAYLTPAERDQRAIAGALQGTVKQRLIGTLERGAAIAQLVELGPQQRLVDAGADTRTVALTFSSEARVPRSYGTEMLSHARGAANLERLNEGAPLLFNHKLNDVIGVVEKASIGDDRRGHATVRFAKTQRGTDVLGMVQDRILRNVSVQYSVDDVDDSKPGDFLVTRWTPMELSIVTVPADSSVGVGRNLP